MTRIQDSSYPLVFRTRDDILTSPEVGAGQSIAVRTAVRALEGMQKEAIVKQRTPAGETTWRMVSDEGPYLNGTDLAPFPLAFFMAGMQFALLSELLTLAEAQAIALQSLAVVQDNFFTMNGSAIRGDMIGGAKSPKIIVHVEGDAPADVIGRLVQRASDRLAAHALLRRSLANSFALTFNGRAVELPDLNASPRPIAGDLNALFYDVRPADPASFREELITRQSQAKKKMGVEGGAASSLQAEQKRTLHIHGEALWLRDRLLETSVQLYQPIGSTFQFFSDETRAAGGSESAPPPVVYLAAGIGFCYMTQIGRYAHITKQALKSYAILQDNIFTVRDERGYAGPTDTHVFLEADEPDAVAQKTVWMGERTCFLHAAMRGEVPAEIEAKLNGHTIFAAT